MLWKHNRKNAVGLTKNIVGLPKRKKKTAHTFDIEGDQWAGKRVVGKKNGALIVSIEERMTSSK